MSKTDNRPNAIPWPPLVYAAAIALSVLLHFMWPLPWIGPPLDGMLMVIGVLLILGGFALAYSAIKTLRDAKTTVSPVAASDHLVTAGPFSFSRNPIYLANTMLTIGAGLAFAILWFLPLAILAAWLTTRLAISREEAHLEHRFGKAWRDYRKKVRRWI